MKFMQIHYNYDKFSRLTDEISVRRQIINELINANAHKKSSLPVSAMMSMNIFDLHATVEQEKLDTIMNDAATKIQRKFRAFIMSNYTEHKIHVESRAAGKIQSQWRVHRMRGFRDALAQAGRNMAAVKLQKYMQGYLFHTRRNYHIRKKKLEQNEKFFEKMRERVLTDVAIYLQYIRRRSVRERNKRRKPKKNKRDY